jgi:hypothetical protein
MKNIKNAIITNGIQKVRGSNPLSSKYLLCLKVIFCIGSNLFLAM